MHRYSHVRSSLALITFAALTAALTAQGTPIGFEETYALSTDRAKAVATLTPGTDDWFYYSCRERLDARDFESVRKLLPTWTQKNGHNARVYEIEHRLALLSFDTDANSTYDYLRGQLGLRWDHQRVVPGERSSLPTRLDPALLSTERLTRNAFSNHSNSVDGFTDRALPGIAAGNLSDEQLYSLLSRLDRPDIENLPALVVRDLTKHNNQQFGYLGIHRELRREQLDECARLLPRLLRDENFVQAYLVRLQPSADTVWQKDPAARAAQYARLWEFTQRLPASFNSLRAHILHHWLLHDLSQGAPNKDRFLAYIRLPRRTAYPSETLRLSPRNEEFVDGNRNYTTGLPVIGDPSALIRTCLEYYFAREDSYEPYSGWIHENWLRMVFAETKLLLGQGEQTQWTAMLGSNALEELEKRVEITFPPTQRMEYAANDPVTLTVDTKNVPTLLVKVFAIDSFRFHQEQQKDVDASIELDGVVANSEQTYTYTEPPLRREHRTFDLPMLKEPGTYVVEFVGNGISSRAVIQKGGLRYTDRVTAAGQVFRVYDETGAQVKDAAIWFGGRDYTADKNGEILLPFSTAPGAHKVVMHRGNRSAIATFAHHAESYDLSGSMHVAREALIAGQKATIVVRPQLRLEGNAIALQLLTDPVLTIVATDLDGTVTPKEVRDLKLTGDREVTYEITVPEHLQSLQVTLRGSVKDLNGKAVELSTQVMPFVVNGIDPTPATSSPMLVRTPEGYAVEVRGKNGEPKAGQTLQLHLRHQDYKDLIDVPLQTDANGRAELGMLSGIESVQVDQPGVYGGSFELRDATCRVPAVLHGLAGETLRVPYQGKATSVTNAAFSLLGQEHDELSHLALADGFVEIRDLPAGDYQLRLHETETSILVRITAGQRNGPWLLGKDRLLEATATQPLNLSKIETVGDELLVRLANYSPDTRVHVIATRFVPTFDVFSDLRGLPADVPGIRDLERPESIYQAGRKLGDEYRYVLERRYQPKYAGNMLRRPSLLANPWAFEDNSKNEAVGLGGGAGSRFGGRGGARGGRAAKQAGGEGGGSQPNPGTFANLDYLPRGASALYNLTPDASGVVRIKLTELGQGQILTVLAIDGDQALQNTVVRNEQPLQPRAQVLARSLDGTQHYLEQKRIEFVAAGKEAVIGDTRAADVEIYDSIAGVYRLLTSVSRDASLAQFAFLLEWPKLDAAKKQELYSQHACHELHFFLYHKDRPFFDAVCKPFLANKHDKTFLDHWLLGDDLKSYAETWAFAQLNLVEQLLLAQRLGGTERDAVARLVREALELRPVERERLDSLFGLALKTASMDDKKGGLMLGFVPGDPTAPDAAGAPGAIRPYRGPGDAVPPAPETVAERRKATAELADREEAKNDVPRPGAAGPATSGPTGPSSPGPSRDQQLAEELGRRGEARQLYRAVEPTKLLVEHDYWHRQNTQATPNVVAPNDFWVDYATAPEGQPFVSSAIIQTGGSFLEMMMALSLIDLPFEAGKHEVTADGDRRTLRAATPLLLVKKEIQKVEKATGVPQLLLGENFYRLDDRYRFENGERRDAFVSDEFLVDVAYGCQVVVTNPTSSKRTTDVLLQIPAGAIPVQKGFWTKGVTVELQPYATQSIEYAFYFPAAGDFAHYPAHAAEKDKLAANAEPRTLHVVTTPTKVDIGSWEHVSQQGTAAEVMTFLDTHNVQRLDLSKVAWRMKDREFFAALLPKLRARHVYDDTLWSYGMLHRDAEASREYLRHADGFLQACGMAIDSPLVTIDPIERKQYRHLELDPLVHQRAHQLGSVRKIGNADLARQYTSLMTLLGYQPKLDSEDWLVVTYYLLLQDRIEDALAAFAKIDRNAVHEVVQFDYLQAYMCFFTAEGQKARGIAERYKTYPVQHWQKRFADVLAQLDEAEGKTTPVAGEPTADSLAATAPAVELAIEAKQLTVRYKNVAQCEVRYYELDVEFAFSAQPFAGQNGATAAFVQPNLRETKDLPQTQGELTFALPAQFAQKNVLVEVRAGGLLRAQTYFSNALAVRFLESYGQVAVTEPGNNTPLPKTYVKVFAKLPNGEVRFHKDGYTDLRGRFDYASVSDDPNAGAVRYSVLVLNEQRGAVIREVAPPVK
jgi:hypothetical protein